MLNQNMIRRTTTVGLVGSLFFAGTLFGWASMASWSGAVIGSGQVVVESSTKKLQHPTGGVVDEIAVIDGQYVSAGDTLIRLNAKLLQANTKILAGQIDEALAKRSRLLAEREQNQFVEFDTELTERQGEAATAIKEEIDLFGARKVVREGQKEQLRARIEQTRSESEGLRAQRESVEAQLQLISGELKGVRELYRSNLVPLTRVNSLERDAASLLGKRGELIAATAQAAIKISEANLQILQIDASLIADSSNELRNVAGSLATLRERKAAAQDQLERAVVVAPVSGYVHQLSTRTVGGVIGPGEVFMMIVPSADKLVVEARIQPQDVDQLVIGQTARVKVHAFNQRTTPELRGKVAQISADVNRDQRTDAAYFTVRIDISDVADQVQLHAGMQAEVFFVTVDRTPLEYLLKPINEQWERAFKER